MSGHKTGLHKGVEAIFKGVRIPKKDDAQQAAPAPMQKTAAETSPKTPAPQPPPQTPAAPSHMTPTKPKPQPTPQPKVQQPVQPAPKAAPSSKRTPSAAFEASKKLFAEKVWAPVKDKFLSPKKGVSASRQKTIVVLVPVLFVVLIVVLAVTLSGPSGRKTAKDQFNPSGRIDRAAGGSGITWQRPALYPPSLRDPMRFGTISTTEEVSSESDKLVVKGIVFSEDNPSAVIGEQIMHEGDKAANITIVKIHSDSVEFELDGKRWTQKVQK